MSDDAESKRGVDFYRSVTENRDVAMNGDFADRGENEGDELKAFGGTKLTHAPQEGLFEVLRKVVASQENEEEAAKGRGLVRRLLGRL